jgi:hypothetical protein
MWISFPSTTIELSFASILSNKNLPYAESYFNKCASVFASVRSLIATISISFSFQSFLNANLPILPNPFIAIFFIFYTLPLYNNIWYFYNIDMYKIKSALSNKVYSKENKIIKVLVKNKFKDIFCANEIEIIKNYNNILVESSKDKIILRKIKYSPKEKYSYEDLILIAAEIKKFHKIEIKNKELTPFADAAKFLGMEKDISKVLKILKRDPVLCHNDLVQGNILFQKNKIRFIDFEYS